MVSISWDVLMAQDKTLTLNIYKNMNIYRIIE